jgi:hypothetical protein
MALGPRFKIGDILITNSRKMRYQIKDIDRERREYHMVQFNTDVHSTYDFHVVDNHSTICEESVVDKVLNKYLN